MADESPYAYPDWHSHALRVLLDGQRLTTAALLTARGSGSATTATAALREFQERYLPATLRAATLAAPTDVADIMAQVWTRLATTARTAAAAEFAQARASAERARAALTSRLTAQEQATAEVTQRATQALAQLEAARHQLQQAQAAAAANAAALAQLREQVAALSAERTQLSESLTHARARAHDTDERLAAVVRDAGAAEAAHREALAQARAQHEATLARRESDQQTALVQLRVDLEARIGDGLDAVRAAQERTQALEQECAALRESQTLRERECSQLREALAGALARERANQDAAQALHSERDRLQVRCDQLQSTLDAVALRARRKPPRSGA